jgi:beta-lactamase class D
MSGGLTKAWLSSTLKISAEEQIEFLRRLWAGQLSASPRAVALVKSSVDTERSERGAELSGKTGSGSMDDRRSRLGWFVGRLESGGKEYFFAVDFSDAGRKGQAGQEARDIVRDVLRSKGLF